MKELKEIIRAYDKAVNSGLQCALATVVLVEGSAYRREGARMLITRDGKLTGAISGGCLEGDALRKALLAMDRHQPMLVTYDTTDDDDAKVGVGLGCSGIIHILIEPIQNNAAANPVELIRQVIRKRQKSVLITLFSLSNRKSAQPGTCFLLTEDTHLDYAFDDEVLKEQLKNDALFVLKNGNHLVKAYHYQQTAFTGFAEIMPPPVSLVIVGAGNDALPLAQLAEILGWETTIIDGRANYATAHRFPQAKQILVAKPAQVCQALTFDERTVVVLMTHNYNYEVALLAELLPLNLNYIGILGPKKKFDRMLSQLADGGMKVTAEQLQGIYAPVGLDIGSEGAEEIALSIIAEIKAVLTGRDGISLKNKPLPIHYDKGLLNQWSV